MRTSTLIPLLPALLLAVACGGDRDPADDPAGREPAAADTAATDAGAAARSAEAPDLTAICDTIDNSLRCARAIERRQLPTATPVTRRGDTLRLALADGDTVRLTDRQGRGDDVVHYSFQRHWQGLFVVHLQAYEGSEFLLIDDRTGDRTAVPDRPLPSPDARRFAVLAADVVAGYGPNTIQVWRLDGREPELEWETEPDGWGAVDGEWLDRDRLRFTRECGPAVAGEAFCGRTGLLVRDDDGWSIREGGGDGG